MYKSLHETPRQEFLGVVEREMQLPRIGIMALAGSVSGTLQRTYKVSAPCHKKRQTGGGRCQGH